MRYRSKQEEALAYLRAFDKERAITEREIFETQYKLFSYKRIDRILNQIKLAGVKQDGKAMWCQCVRAVYDVVREPTTSRSVHSGNLFQITKQNKYIHRFKDDKNIWRYYLY